MNVKDILLSKLMLVMMICMAFCGCSDDEQGDFCGNLDIYVGPYFYVADSNGNDLLDPNNTNGIDMTKVKVVIFGQELAVGEPIATKSEYGNDILHYASVCHDDLRDRYMLRFHGFYGGDVFHDETVSVKWDNGAVDVFTFSLYQRAAYGVYSHVL